MTVLKLALLLLFSQGGYRAQYPLPDMTVASGLGVNVHIIAPKDDSIEQIAKAGFKWIRMDMLWDTVEHTQGEYDFSQYDKLQEQLDKYKLRPIYILDYGNNYYQEGAPRSSEAKAAFVRFVHATIQHYRHKGAIWEMYNEPNIHFWKPFPNVNEYLALANAVGEEIRENEPDEWFVGPSVSGMDFKFLGACLSGGMLSYWDAVSVHPYRTTSPETAIDDWRHLEDMIAANAPEGKRISPLCSEWGYSQLNYGEEKQAQYVIREYLSNLVAGVPLTIWYDWSNDAEQGSQNPEAFFGIVDHDLQTKQALLAVRALVKELSGWTYAKRLPSDPEDYVLEFTRKGNMRVVAWSPTDGREIGLGLPAGNYSVTPLGGEPKGEHCGKDGLDVTLGGMPVVVAPAA